MSNPRITPKDRNLLKGALRRAFARSELHERVVAAAMIEHFDPSRPRCKKWIRCAQCKLPNPKWSSAVDHIVPLIPINSSMAEMSLDEVADRCWCEESNLQVLCKSCHDVKTTAERIAREDSQIARGLRKPRKPKKARKKTA